MCDPSRSAGPAGLVTALRPRSVAIMALLTLAFPASARAERQSPKGLIAVLPLDASNAKLRKADRIVLEESIRTAAGVYLTPAGYTVLTGETTLAMLADNRIDPAKVCDASCALAAARELSARLFLSGTIVTSGGVHVAFVRLIETVGGRQLASVNLSGHTARDLASAFESHAPAFFGRVTSAGQAVAGTSLKPAASDAQAPAHEIPVSFKSDPPGATVILDGELLCQTTPCRKVVLRGNHDVAMAKDRFTTTRKQLDFQKEGEVSLNLLPAWAILGVTTVPDHLPLVVNGQPAGTAPFEKREVTPGAYEIAVADPCRMPARERVVLDPGSTQLVKLEAPERQSDLRVVARDPAGRDVPASVAVDGADLGSAPGSFRVRTCSREVIVTPPGGSAQRRVLDLKADELADVRFVVETHVPDSAIAPGVTPNEARPDSATRWTRNTKLGVTALALAAVAGGVGTALAFKARKTARDLGSTPHDGVEAQKILDTANGQAVQAQVSFGVTGLLAAAGITLVWVFP